MGWQQSNHSEAWHGHVVHVAKRELAHFFLLGGALLLIASMSMPLLAAPEVAQITDEEKLYAAAFVVSRARNCPFQSTQRTYNQCMQQVLGDGLELSDRVESHFRRLSLNSPRHLRLCDISEKGKIPLADAKGPLLWTCLDIPADPREEDSPSGTMVIGLMDQGGHRLRIRYTFWFPDMSPRIETE